MKHALAISSRCVSSGVKCFQYLGGINKSPASATNSRKYLKLKLGPLSILTCPQNLHICK